MRRPLPLIVLELLICSAAQPARADDKEAIAILDKAIKAMGGEEKLNNAAAYRWKGKLKRPNGEELTIEHTFHELDRHRTELRGETQFGTLHIKSVLNDQKAWQKRNDDATNMFSSDSVAAARRENLREVCATRIFPLKGKGFRVETAGEESVGDVRTSVLKIISPDGSDFKLSFDQASGLPIKLASQTTYPNGSSMTKTRHFSQFKEFDGIKVATKIVQKANETTMQEIEITDFKVLDKVDPSLFAEPQ